MKHTIDVKFPKLFGRKQEGSNQGSHITTEITVDVDKLKKLVVPVSVGVAGLSIGYLVGFKSGVVKVLDTEVIFIEG